MLLEDSCYLSTLSTNFQARILTLPIIQDDIQTFSIRNIPHEQTQRTLKHIISIQKRFPMGVIPKIIFFVVMGVLMVYFGMVFVVLSLFNLVVFFIFVVLLFRYMSWSVGMVRRHRKKWEKKLIQVYLQKENKRYYSKKLIKWELDQSQIVIHNLRLVH